MNFARLLTLPFFAVAIIVAYRIFTRDLVYESIYIAFAVVGATLIFIFSPQINWWFWQYYPPKISDKLRAILNQSWPDLVFHNSTDRERMLVRTILFTRGNEIRFMGTDNAPEDIGAIIGTIPVRMTAHLPGSAYLMQPYERIILYTDKFLSPDFPYPHTSETNHEDAVLVFSVKHLLEAFREPEKFFNIGFYEYAGVYRKLYPALAYPELDPEIHWPLLEQISGFRKKQLEDYLVMKQLDINQFAITTFWVAGKRFKSMAPSLYAEFDRVFQQG